MNLRTSNTERTLEEGLFAFKLDHRFTYPRGDARDKDDDQRMCLYLCNYNALMSFFFVCHHSRGMNISMSCHQNNRSAIQDL